MNYIQQPAGLVMQREIDLGHDYFLRYFVWSPDMKLVNNAMQYAHLAHLIRKHPVVGAIIRHKCKTETGIHEGVVHFHTELTDIAPGFKRDIKWQVLSWEPLSLSPSLQMHCPCGAHGFIREGRWVKC